MSEEIFHETTLLMYSILFGICIVFVYDIFLSLRKAFRHGKILTAIEDILFLTACTIAAFTLFYELNLGIVRGYAICGIILGMLLYKTTISPYLVGIMSTLFKLTIYIVSTPIKRCIYGLSWMFKKVYSFCKTRLTVCIKLSTITLCKGVSIVATGRYGHKKRHNRHNRMGMFLASIVVLMLMIVISVNSMSLREKLDTYTSKTESLQALIDEEEERAESLVEFEKYSKTKAYYEEVAREKLGLIYPSEIIFKSTK